MGRGERHHGVNTSRKPKFCKPECFVQFTDPLPLPERKRCCFLGARDEPEVQGNAGGACTAFALALLRTCNRFACASHDAPRQSSETSPLRPLRPPRFHADEYSHRVTVPPCSSFFSSSQRHLRTDSTTNCDCCGVGSW